MGQNRSTPAFQHRLSQRHTAGREGGRNGRPQPSNVGIASHTFLFNRSVVDKTDHYLIPRRGQLRKCLPTYVYPCCPCHDGNGDSGLMGGDVLSTSTTASLRRLFYFILFYFSILFFILVTSFLPVLPKLVDPCAQNTLPVFDTSRSSPLHE
ncbi:hypothetical protein LZ31DRAFT_14545 [Colletotrichum somersetense]|nr:hypothetical protein LZ31DRAFT_14545 [Colletotrichum somersetense]